MGMGMEPVIEVLPEGWREKARELNAFRRAGDYLKTPEDLLRFLLLWADLGTLAHTAAFLRTAGDLAMSKVTIFQRVQKSKEYFPVRICAQGKTKEAIEQGTKRIKVANSGKNGEKLRNCSPFTTSSS